MAEDAKPTDEPEARPLPPIAGKAQDLEALRNAVVDAANVGAGLWFSYLFVLLYLVIAVGSVTHRNLLLETPVRLPFLNVDLPLLGFFVLGPALFLIVHAYVLLHFVLLAGKVGVFHAELEAQIADEAIRARLRRSCRATSSCSFLPVRAKCAAVLWEPMLRLIAQISLVAGPLALLVFFLVQFLPYHHEAIAWWQRIAVVIDLALLWALWPSVARGEMAWIGWRDLRRRKVAVVALLSLVPVFFVFTIATFPGEWLDRNPARCASSRGPRRRAGSACIELLFAGDVDLVTRAPTSLWSNRLVLPGVDVLEQGKFNSDAKIAAVSGIFAAQPATEGGGPAWRAPAQGRFHRREPAGRRCSTTRICARRVSDASASRMKVDNVSAEGQKTDFQEAEKPERAARSCKAPHSRMPSWNARTSRGAHARCFA